jgi:aspartyl-tRNA(Asn)/glutamyl-tRNA(Gln) amidotransferase subunit B
LAELILLINEGTISGKIAKEVFPEMLETGKNPKQIVEEKGLSQLSDTSALEVICQQVLTENAKIVEDFRNGKEKAFGALVGKVMALTKGSANPQMVNTILGEILKK